MAIIINISNRNWLFNEYLCSHLVNYLDTPHSIVMQMQKKKAEHTEEEKKKLESAHIVGEKRAGEKATDVSFMGHNSNLVTKWILNS